MRQGNGTQSENQTQREWMAMIRNTIKMPGEPEDT